MDLSPQSSLEPEVIEEIQRGRKVGAIKILRELRGIDLKQAKNLVDAYCAQHDESLSSLRESNAGNGVVLIIILCVITYILYKYFV